MTSSVAALAFRLRDAEVLPNSVEEQFGQPDWCSQLVLLNFISSCRVVPHLQVIHALCLALFNHTYNDQERNSTGSNMQECSRTKYKREYVYATPPRKFVS